MALSKNDAGPNTTVLDLGCGVGMLGLGFALVHSDAVYLLDCDDDALNLTRENVDYLVEEELLVRDDEEECACVVEVIGAKVEYVRPKGGTESRGRDGRGRGRGRSRNTKGRGGTNKPQTQPSMPKLVLNSMEDGIPLPPKVVDTVITNPPFGTKNNEGIDVQFLKTSIRLARRAVYSFHKTSTRQYLLKLISSWGLNVEVVAEMKFDIHNMYKFHKEKVKDVEVDLIRVSFRDDNQDSE